MLTYNNQMNREQQLQDYIDHTQDLYDEFHRRRPFLTNQQIDNAFAFYLEGRLYVLRRARAHNIYDNVVLDRKIDYLLFLIRLIESYKK